MYGSEYPDPRSSLWHHIASEIRQFRTVLGLTGTQFGQILHCDKSTVSKIEHGVMRLKPDQARLLDAYERSFLPGALPSDQRPHLDRTPRPGTIGRWEVLVFHAGREQTEDWYEAHQEHEERATALRVWEPLLVPGLMQTPEYAREVFHASGQTDVDAKVEARMRRQERFLTDGGPYLWVLIDEGVLDRFDRDHEIMHAQLDRLLEFSKRDNIGLRAIRRGRFHSGLDGPFEIMSFAAGVPSMAYTEAAQGWRLISDVAEVDLFALRYERLSQLALPEHETRDFIRKYLEKT